MVSIFFKLYSRPFRLSFRKYFLLKTQTKNEQVVVLLTIEVPRAATGRSPCLLPHLWGVGMEEHEYAGAGSSTGVDHYAAADRGVLGGRGEGWVSGEERVKLTLLLVVNGLFLYGHVLALFALLSRLSSTAFAIVR